MNLFDSLLNLVEKWCHHLGNAVFPPLTTAKGSSKSNGSVSKKTSPYMLKTPAKKKEIDAASFFGASPVQRSNKKVNNGSSKPVSGRKHSLKSWTWIVGFYRFLRFFDWNKRTIKTWGNFRMFQTPGNQCNLDCDNLTLAL